jgi:hypothetical protein
VGNLPRWEDLELQADQVVDEVFSGVESSLDPTFTNLEELLPERGHEEAPPEKTTFIERIKPGSRGEWLFLGTALSSVALAGSVWFSVWFQANPSTVAKAQEVPQAEPPSLQPPVTAAVAPVSAASVLPVAAVNQEEKIIQRYKQDIQATKTALGNKAGNKANPFFPSVKITPTAASGTVITALPPGSQQPFQVPKGQTPTVLQPAQAVAQAPLKVQPAQPRIYASVPQRYNIPPLPRILPAPPSLRPLKANGSGSLPPLPSPNQMQAAVPNPSPSNAVQTAAPATGTNAAPQSPDNTQTAARATSQAKQPPQTVASAAPAHSLVGIMGTGSKRQTALIKTGDSMKEVLPGDQVGGGWVLQSIAENQVTMQQGNQTKVLTLGDP